jgi:hypothetical protein
MSVYLWHSVLLQNRPEEKTSLSGTIDWHPQDYILKITEFSKSVCLWQGFWGVGKGEVDEIAGDKAW